QIVDALKISPLNVSHHLTVLKHAKLIRGEKRGRFVIYSLCDGVLHEVVEAGVPKESLHLGCCQLGLPKGEGAPGQSTRGIGHTSKSHTTTCPLSPPAATSSPSRLAATECNFPAPQFISRIRDRSSGSQYRARPSPDTVTTTRPDG